MYIKDLDVYLQLEQGLSPVVNGLNFTLLPGQTTAVVGESGSGKSMTSLALMRLLPFNAFYGALSEVHLAGEALLSVPEVLMRALRGKRIAMVFQEPMTALNPVKTIGSQLAEALLQVGPWAKKALQARLVSLLEEVEMPDPSLKLQEYPHQLSGGQKQRVVIAMALANHPEVLIADEPTTALDLTVQLQILNLLKKLEQQYNMSLLLITHDLGVVQAMADKVLVMYAGEIVEEANKEDFFKGVKHPYSQRLLAAIPNFEKRGERLQTIPGTVPSLDSRPEGCRFHPRCPYVFERCLQEKPELISVASSFVRCHLYPKQDALAPLAQKKQYHDARSVLEREVFGKEPLLQVVNLSVHYRVSKSRFTPDVVIKAVDNVSFDLYPGTTLALVGESGSGKTTISRALLGLSAITSGSISYKGHSLLTMNRQEWKRYRHHVQLIFQDPFSSMNPRLTVGDIIAEGMIAQKMKAATIAARQKKLLDQVNLPSTSLNKYPHQFSGGQRQRICIARAIATEPELLICDEPTSALDISVQAQILNLLHDLQEELKITYLFITHNMAVVAYMADNVLVLHEGKALEMNDTETILKNPQNTYTQKLLQSVLS